MRKSVLYILFILFSFASCEENDPDVSADMIVDHRCLSLDDIPVQWISEAKNTLHIAYGHTSHGSQLTTGMSGLMTFRGDTYKWNETGADGALDLDDYAMSGDLGNPDRTSWAERTRTYLAANTDVNVIMWSWCGQVSTATEADISTYLNLMADLEKDFPGVRFVYMTGHLDGSGLNGNLHQRNEQIRNYCRQNKKILFDFADIESYDPDGAYFGDKNPDDGCNYDNDGDGTRERNWASEWQDSHAEGVDWFTCVSAHSMPLNANMKSFAAWWMWARLAGWNGRQD